MALLVISSIDARKTSTKRTTKRTTKHTKGTSINKPTTTIQKTSAKTTKTSTTTRTKQTATTTTDTTKSSTSTFTTITTKPTTTTSIRTTTKVTTEITAVQIVFDSINPTANANGLAKHNELRAKHGVPDLILDEEITSVAQSYANYLAANDLFQHSLNKRYGENLYYACSSASAPDADSKEIKSLELKKTLKV